MRLTYIKWWFISLNKLAKFVCVKCWMWEVTVTVPAFGLNFIKNTTVNIALVLKGSAKYFYNDCIGNTPKKGKNLLLAIYFCIFCSTFPLSHSGWKSDKFYQFKIFRLCLRCKLLSTYLFMSNISMFYGIFTYSLGKNRLHNHHLPQHSLFS